MIPRRLRYRVALTFGLLSLIVASASSLITYELVRSYLSDQREQGAVSRALVDARLVDSQGSSTTVTSGNGSSTGVDAANAELLDALPALGGGQRLLRVDDEWFSSGVTVSPDDLPASLLTTAAEFDGAQQRFSVGDSVYLGVAVPVTQGMYVEVFPLAELASTLDRIGSSLFLAAVLASVLGVAVGWFAARRLLRPVRRLAHTADEIASGNLTERMGTSGDADLDQLSTAFDDMADSVQQRIERERRFVANVGHELRTPVTVALGTVEILDQRSANLSRDDASLLTLLGQQVSRLGQTVLDLLELGTITPETVPHLERVDTAQLARAVLEQRGHNSAELTVSADAAVVTDPRRLERMLANLVENADSHGGGLTAVSIDRRDDAVVIDVDDSGPGVTREERDSIFELFARGSASTPGTGSGLGLSIVAEQAELLGATVSVADAPSGGARFTVSLPVNGPTMRRP